MNEPKVTAILQDFGARIGVAIEYNGKRKAVSVANPLWPEIEAEWKRTHSFPAL